jgi:hypothetical protein
MKIIYMYEVRSKYEECTFIRWTTQVSIQQDCKLNILKWNDLTMCNTKIK